MHSPCTVQYFQSKSDVWNSDETATPKVFTDWDKPRWVAHRFKKVMCHLWQERHRYINFRMYSKNPPWFHLFKTVDYNWEHWAFNITDFARNSEKIPSSGILGIKSPSWLWRDGWKRISLFSCILPQHYYYSSKYAMYGKLWYK